MLKSNKNFALIFILLNTIALFSCTNRDSKNRNTNDTTAVIQAALNNRSFLKDHIVAKSDTLYFLKSKNYTSGWPTESTYFKIIYIPDTEDAKSINMPSGKLDSRIRIGIPKLTIGADTASVVLYNFGYNAEYHFSLKRENEIWNVIKYNTLIN
jgi:hypothetical protein